MGQGEKDRTLRDSSNRAGCAATAISQPTVSTTDGRGRGRSCYYDYRGSGYRYKREKQIKTTSPVNQ